ncbi:MAG: hypothetical protein Q9160_005443 [Pyrenula sp. 1 TL-2023]
MAATDVEETERISSTSLMQSETSRESNAYSTTPNSAHFRLLDLPNELVLRILQCLDDKHTVFAACKVNRLFRTYAEPLISIDLLVVTALEGQWAAGKIAEHPPRARQITSLMVAHPERTHEPGPSFFPTVAKMSRLEDLIIEATDYPPQYRRLASENGCPHEQEEVVRLFRLASLLRTPSERILPSLRSCEVQFLYDNHNLWDLSSLYVIFLHPTLESLTIGCGGWPLPEGNALVKTQKQDIINSLRKHPKSTNLRTLTFEQCDVNLYALKVILDIPKALKNLNIHECRHYHHPRGWSTQKRHLYLEALSPVRHTLESLSISLSDPNHASIHGLSSFYCDHADWSPFTALRTVAVSPIYILLSKYAERVEIKDILSLANTLPPNLTTIRIWDNSSFSTYNLRQLAKYKRQLGIPNLQLIHYELSTLERYIPGPMHPDSTPATLHDLNHDIMSLAAALKSGNDDHDNDFTRDESEDTSYSASSTSISTSSASDPDPDDKGVQLVVEAVLRVSSHIPPYLYGETRAKRTLMFDSGDKWFYERETNEWRVKRWKRYEDESRLGRRWHAMI